MMKNKKQTPEDVLMNGNNELPSPFTETFAMPTYSDTRPGQTTEHSSFQGEEEAPRFKFLSIEDLEKLPPKEWIIPDLLGRGDLVQIYGPSNEGKTFVALDLFFACLTGGLFAGLESEKLSSVVYMTDEGCSGLGARVTALKENREPTKEELCSLLLCMDVPQLYMNTHPLYATTFIHQWKELNKPLELLFIDTQHSATLGGDENGAKDAGVIIGNLKAIQRELTIDEVKPTIVLIHHAKKDGSSDRGSSGFRAAWDSQFLVNDFTFKTTKQKDAKKRKDWFFDLHPMGDSCVVFWDEKQPENKTLEDKVLKFFEDEQGKEFRRTQVEELVGMKRHHTEKILPKLVEEGKIKSKGGGQGKTILYTFVQI